MVNNHKNAEAYKKLFNSKIPIAYFVGLFIAFIIYNNFYKKESITNAPVTFIQAQELCQQQNKLLPLTSFDFDQNVQQVRPEDSQGYWSAEGKIYYNISLPLSENNGQKHYTRCIDVNGLEYPSVPR